MLKKGIWFVLHTVAVAALAVSLILGVIFWHTFGFGGEVIRKNHSYEKSETLQLNLRNEAGIIWNYFDSKQMLGLLDVEADGSAAAEEIYSLLLDLGITVDDIRVLTEKYGLTEEGIVAFLAEKFNLAEEDIYGFLEEQAAEEAKSAAIFQADMFSDAVDIRTYELEEKAEAGVEIVQALDFYEYAEARYNPENTNVRYTISLDGEYVDSNLPIEDEGNTSEVYLENRDGYELRIYLNSSYPVEDSYSQEAAAYNQFQDTKLIIFMVAVVSIAMILLSLVMLTRMTGKGNGTETVQLSWLDQPPLEIALIFWGIVAVGVIMGICFSAGYAYYEESYFWLIVYILAVVVGSALGMTGYLSLVRRIKTQTLGRNSLCYRFVSAIIKFFYNLLGLTKVSQKILIACSGYVLLMLLLSIIGGRISILAAVIVSAVGLYIVYRDAVSRQQIIDGMEKITSGELDYQIDLSKINLLQMEIAQSANQVGTAMKKTVQQSLKDERLKADLITNVSHDIKTPLTSIINYVDLLKREDIQNEKAMGYLEILDQKSQRLKQLTEDLVEASKLSSGNVILNMGKMDFNEILQQALGEFEEKFQSKNLQVVLKRPEGQVAVLGEGRRIWRILENLFQNVYKYAMPGTRVYAELVKGESDMTFTLKNISQHSLNFDVEDLTERFIRGDVARTTEGSGLGLSIAKDLTTLQKGGFEIHLDGDLFKAILKFELIGEN